MHGGKIQEIIILGNCIHTHVFGISLFHVKRAIYFFEKIFANNYHLKYTDGHADLSYRCKCVMVVIQ